jgi:hypothetical protein
MAANVKVQLNEALQGILHQNIAQYYTRIPNYLDALIKVELTLHRATFNGSATTLEEAELEAARQALQRIQTQATETQVRQLLGLGPRAHLAEMDAVRVQIQHLRRRTNLLVAINTRKKYIARQLGYLHKAVDKCEKLITTSTGISD